MVPVALGTQTKGSVLRPASYCGVTGFKASYGLLPMEGVLPLAKSLATLGFFTHTPADMVLLWESMGHLAEGTEDFALGAPKSMSEVEAAMAAACSECALHVAKRWRVHSVSRYRRNACQTLRCGRYRNVLRGVLDSISSALTSMAPRWARNLWTWFKRACGFLWNSTTTPDGISRSARPEWPRCIRRPP